MTIELHPVKLGWIKGPDDDPADQCAHSPVRFRVNGTVFVSPDDGRWTVSATALYLLRSLHEDHVPGADHTVSGGSQLFPCCAFGGVPSDGDHAVVFFGCPNGMDVRIERAGETVRIGSDRGFESVSYRSWVQAVKAFASSVVDFYEECRPKAVVEDAELRAAWEGFWKELARRRLDSVEAAEATSIRTPEQVAEVFSIFHDGGVDGVRSIGSDVELDIGIEYLASRIDASFSRFHVRLHGCSGIRFLPYRESPESRGAVVVGDEAVEGLELEILSATVENTAVHVLCLAHAGGESVDDGTLELLVSGATVFDDGRRPVSLAAPVELCDGYWKEWEESGR